MKTITSMVVNRDDSDVNYPYGKCINDTTAGDHTGTEDVANFHNEALNALYAILTDRGIVPNGSIEIVGASQVSGAIQIFTGPGVGLATLTYASSALSHTYTIPDVLTDADFVMTQGAQTIAGAKLFSDLARFDVGLRVDQGEKVSLNSAETSYWTESSTGDAQLFLNSVQALRVQEGDGLILEDVDPPAANYMARRSGLKAWVEYDDDVGITTSFNVDSVLDDDGDGVFEINWDTDYLTTDYVMTASVGNIESKIIAVWTRLAGEGQVKIWDNITGVAVDADFNVVSAGVQ